MNLANAPLSLVDENFWQYVRAKCGSELIRQFSETEPLAFLEMKEAWERIKSTFDSGQGYSAHIPLPVGLYRMLAKRPHPDEVDDSLEIDSDILRSFFQPFLKAITDDIEKHLARLDAGGKTCDFLFLIGGSSGCCLLQETVHRHFHMKTRQVIFPREPTTAIMLGAVSYGYEPVAIRARITRMTFGIETALPFDPDIDPENKRFWDERLGAMLCKNRFDILIRADESVNENRAVIRQFLPLEKNQTRMVLSIYITNRREVRYTDEPHCRHIGQLTIERADTSSGYDWPVEVTMNFGDTEIKVSARDIRTGKEVKTKLEFSSTYFPEFIDE